ncbi:putative protein MSS51 homolog, mitochondrial [Macrobrachium rosenbergii]|uniref:putative protein MSS51 homolog, mitochondrial n=1 Tax=Macrobrachium rosenbergii TaxID=79674 RepID=UPI0034D5D720
MAEDCEETLQEFGFENTRHFHPGLCATCLKSPYHVKLKHCAQCQLVSYCSRVCQKSDWKVHRQFCLANAVKFGKNVFSEAKTKVTSFKSWTQFRTSLQCAVSVNLKRVLEQFEREAVWFPKVCEICKDADLSKLFPCSICNSIFYCSKEHLEQDIDQHIHWCGEYLTCVSVDQFLLRRDSADVSFILNVKENFQPLPEDMTQLLNSETGLSQKVIPTDGKMLKKILTDVSFADELTVIIFNILTSESVTDAITLLYALEKFCIGKDKKKICDITELNIHVVGADGMRELMSLTRWEYIAHRLPNLKKLRVSFIGPEVIPAIDDTVPEDFVYSNGEFPVCEECEQSDRDFEYRFCNVLYHHYVKKKHFFKPDAVIAYNCGFHAHSGLEMDTWPESLKLIISDPDIPLIFTSFSKEEADKELQVLKNLQDVSITLPSQPNPFKSLRPCRDFSRDNNCHVFYVNHFITCVNGEKICN